MANAIKYSESVVPLTLRKGDFYLLTGNEIFGTTSATGFWNGYDLTNVKYVIYLNRPSNGPSIYAPVDDNELIAITNKIANTNYSTASECIAWFATQSDKMVVNKTYPPLVTDGSILSTDASFLPSYPTQGTSFYDLSGNNNNGTLVNGPTFNSNGYLNFDGVDDYINLSSTLTLSGSFTWTINCKSNVMSSVQNRQVYLGGNSTYFEQSDNDTFFIVNSPVLNLELPIGLLPQNQFYNITLTRKADNTFDFYYNGVKQILRSGGTTPISASFILNRIGSTGFSTRFWNGSMSNIIIYNKLLNDNEILQNYYQAPIVTDGLVFAVDAGNLVSYESGSTTTYSLTGSLSGSLINGVGYNSVNGGSWIFDGIDDFISGSDTPFRFTNTFTLDAWVYFNGSNIDGTIIGKRNGSPFNQYALAIYSGNPYVGGVGKVATFFGRADGGSPDITLNYTLPSAGFYNIVASINATSQTLYVNGVARATTSVNISSNTFNISGRDLLIGATRNNAGTGINSPFLGNIYNVKIYNRTLSASEVSQNFNAQRSRFGI